MQSEQHELAEQRPQRGDMVPSPKASDADREAALNGCGTRSPTAA